MVCYSGPTTGVSATAKYSVKTTANVPANDYRVYFSYSDDGADLGATDYTGYVAGGGLHPSKSLSNADVKNSGVANIRAQRLEDGQCIGLIAQVKNSGGSAIADAAFIVTQLQMYIDVDPAYNNELSATRVACGAANSNNPNDNACAHYDVHELMGESAGGASKMNSGIFLSPVGGLFIAGGPSSQSSATSVNAADNTKSNTRVLIGRTNPQGNATDLFNGMQQANLEVIAKSGTKQAISGVAWDSTSFDPVITVRNGRHSTASTSYGSGLFTHDWVTGLTSLGYFDDGSYGPVAVVGGDQFNGQKGWVVAVGNGGGGLGVAKFNTAPANPGAMLAASTLIGNDATTAADAAGGIPSGVLFIDENRNGTRQAGEDYVAPFSKLTATAAIGIFCQDSGETSGHADGDACCATQGLTCVATTTGGANGGGDCTTDPSHANGAFMAFCH